MSKSSKPKANGKAPANKEEPVHSWSYPAWWIITVISIGNLYLQISGPSNMAIRPRLLVKLVFTTDWIIATRKGLVHTPEKMANFLETRISKVK